MAVTVAVTERDLDDALGGAELTLRGLSRVQAATAATWCPVLLRALGEDCAQGMFSLSFT